MAQQMHRGIAVLFQPRSGGPHRLAPFNRRGIIAVPAAALHRMRQAEQPVQIHLNARHAGALFLHQPPQDADLKGVAPQLFGMQLFAGQPQFDLQPLAHHIGGQFVLGLHLERIGRLKTLGTVGARLAGLAAIRADIICGDDKALAPFDMRFDAAPQQRSRKGAQQQIISAGIDHPVDQAGAFFPGGDDDDDKGIVAAAALAQLLDRGAKLFARALRFADQNVGRALLDGFHAGFERGDAIGAAEAERIQSRTGCGAICRNRIVNQRFDAVIRKTRHATHPLSACWEQNGRAILKKGRNVWLNRLNAGDNAKKIIGLEAGAAHKRAIHFRKV